MVVPLERTTVMMKLGEGKRRMVVPLERETVMMMELPALHT